MPLTSRWVPFYTNLFMTSGALDVFPKNSNRPRRDIVPLTGYCLYTCILPSNTSFRHILEGRQFSILTDHKSLIYSLSSSRNRHSLRQIRHHDFISQFTSDIHHIQGRTNQVANALLRIHKSPRFSSSYTLQKQIC